MEIPRPILFVAAMIIVMMAWGLVANLGNGDTDKWDAREFVCKHTEDPLVALKNCR